MVDSAKRSPAGGSANAKSREGKPKQRIGDVQLIQLLYALHRITLLLYCITLRAEFDAHYFQRSRSRDPQLGKLNHTQPKPIGRLHPPVQVALSLVVVSAVAFQLTQKQKQHNTTAMRASTTLRAGRLAQSLSRPLWQSPAVVRISSRANSTAVETPVNFGAAPPPPPQQQKSGLDGKKLLADAVAATKPRNNWTKEEIAAIYYQPLLELTYQSV